MWFQTLSYQVLNDKKSRQFFNKLFEEFEISECWKLDTPVCVQTWFCTTPISDKLYSKKNICYVPNVLDKLAKAWMFFAPLGECIEIVPILR